MRLRRALALLALGAALVSCTGGGNGGSGDGTGPQGGPEGEGGTPAAVGSPLAAPGLSSSLELTGPEPEGAGEVPTFTWEPVEGAAGYRLVVLGPDGGPIWAWEGTDTSVNLGGLPEERPVGEPGPIVVPGSTWSIAALDADGHVVAVSVSRPVSP